MPGRSQTGIAGSDHAGGGEKPAGEIAIATDRSGRRRHPADQAVVLEVAGVEDGAVLEGSGEDQPAGLADAGGACIALSPEKVSTPPAIMTPPYPCGESVGSG
jgi:hypothetical protein